MTDNRKVFSSIARSVPAIWEVLAPYALNPQPLPPRTDAALNPQPLPPQPEAVGALIGLELARLSWTASKLGQELESVRTWPDNPCDVPRAGFWWPWRWPKFPHTEPQDRQNEAFRGYFLGVACVLAFAEESDFVDDALDAAVEALVATGWDGNGETP